MQNTRKIGKSSWVFKENIRIQASAAVAGPMEGNGKLSHSYDLIYDNLYAGQDTWEQAERKMLEDAVETAIKKADLTSEEIDVYLAGDLLNQNISASFSAKAEKIPFIGMYGACSSSMLTLSVAATLVEGGFARYALAGVSSHNCTAERQYRYPTEYGGQKPNTAQWTATGAGAAIIGIGGTGPRIQYATIGIVTDLGIKNPFDMGSAMAPAAAKTMQTHFEDTGRKPKDYDLIVTGDLASIGAPILKELLSNEGYKLGEQYQDCGLMIYSQDQEVFAGGSGCASSAIVTYGHILQQMMLKKYKKVLVVATGALLSPISYQQGEPIPCIAHAVAIEMDET
ncbi:stage V sporulation protein AD [Polycladospora coralii]|nr:stage V sporulation protein AD [Polycladospora coralii]